MSRGCDPQACSPGFSPSHTVSQLRTRTNRLKTALQTQTFPHLRRSSMVFSAFSMEPPSYSTMYHSVPPTVSQALKISGQFRVSSESPTRPPRLFLAEGFTWTLEARPGYLVR